MDLIKLKKQQQAEYYRKVLNPEKYGKPEEGVFGKIARKIKEASNFRVNFR